MTQQANHSQDTLSQDLPEPETPAVSPDTATVPLFPRVPGWTPHQLARLVLLRAMDVPLDKLLKMPEFGGKKFHYIRVAGLYLGVSMVRIPYMDRSNLSRLLRAFRKGGRDTCLAQFPDRSPYELSARLVAMGVRPGRDIGWRAHELAYLRQSIKLNRSVTEVAANLFISVDAVREAAEALIRGEHPPHRSAKRKRLRPH